MSAIQREILKYERKGFKIEQKRTMKHSTRFFLKKGRGLGGLLGFEGIALYAVDGDSDLENLRECLKDYVKFSEEQEFDASDKGLFAFTGALDDKLFRDLKKAMISDEGIRNSVRAISLGQGTMKEMTPRVKTSMIAKDIRVNTPKLENVLDKIRKFVLHKMPKREKELDSMLVHYLSAFYPNITTKLAYEKATIDAQIGKIGIEIKYQPSASELDRLYGQVEKYLKYLDRIIVVIGYEKSKENTESFRQRLRDRNWLNNRVFIVSLG